ncbi:hypothetical protein J6590_076992, partial [Homalodisca vitripennis]
MDVINHDSWNLSLLASISRGKKRVRSVQYWREPGSKIPTTTECKRSRKKTLSFPNSASVAQRGKSVNLQNGNFPFFWSKNGPLLLLANNPLEIGAQKTSLRTRG